MSLIELKTTSAPFNLAAEEYIFEKTDPDDCPVCIIWQNSDSIIVGFNQNTLSEINQVATEKSGIPVVRRLSGGGAVFHDLSNVNYTFITTFSKQDDLSSFARFAQPVVDFLRSLGVDAETNGRNDICIDGKKISGTAKYVKKGKALFHGTLLFDYNPEKMGSYLKADPDKYGKRGIKSVKSRVTDIKSNLPAEMSILEFKKKLCDYLSQGQPRSLSIEEISDILVLMKDKYCKDEWNYGHFTDYSFTNKICFPFGIVNVGLNIQDGIIKSAKLFGDFFSSKPVQELEALLVEKHHTPEGISAVLESIGGDVSQYISGMSPEDFKSLLF